LKRAYCTIIGKALENISNMLSMFITIAKELILNNKNNNNNNNNNNKLNMY